MVGGCAGYTMVARAVHCFPMQRESPVSSSDGVTTGSKPADAIDRGAKGTPWYAVHRGSVVCTVEPLAGVEPTTSKLQILCSTN